MAPSDLPPTKYQALEDDGAATMASNISIGREGGGEGQCGRPRPRSGRGRGRQNLAAASHQSRPEFFFPILRDESDDVHQEEMMTVMASLTLSLSLMCVSGRARVCFDIEPAAMTLPRKSP